MKFQTQILVAVMTARAAVDAFSPSSIPSRSSTAPLKSAVSGDQFNNDGPFAFMQSSLEKMGIQDGQGKKIVNGVFTAPVDDSTSLSSEERQKRRDEATKNLMNIDLMERNRRDKIGNVATYAATAYVVWAGLFADDGGVGGHMLRFLSIIPIFLAVGYKTSAKEGVCNIGQGGLWDVEGTGLSSIEDQGLANAMLDKVNKMNTEVAIKVAVPVLLFSLLPSSTSHALVFFALAGSILYAFRDQLPQDLKD